MSRCSRGGCARLCVRDLPPRLGPYRLDPPAFGAVTRGPAPPGAAIQRRLLQRPLCAVLRAAAFNQQQHARLCCIVSPALWSGLERMNHCFAHMALKRKTIGIGDSYSPAGGRGGAPRAEFKACMLPSPGSCIPATPRSLLQGTLRTPGFDLLGGPGDGGEQTPFGTSSNFKK